MTGSHDALTLSEPNTVMIQKKMFKSQMSACSSQLGIPHLAHQYTRLSFQYF